MIIISGISPILVYSQYTPRFFPDLIFCILAFPVRIPYNNSDKAEKKGMSMNCKSTDELTHEIKNATNIEDYLADNKTELLAGTLAEQLNLLLSQKDLKNLAPNRLRSFGLSDSSLQYIPLICLLGIMRSIFKACIVLINSHANFLARWIYYILKLRT